MKYFKIRECAGDVAAKTLSTVKLLHEINMMDKALSVISNVPVRKPRMQPRTNRQVNTLFISLYAIKYYHQTINPLKDIQGICV